MTEAEDAHALVRQAALGLVAGLVLLLSGGVVLATMGDGAGGAGATPTRTRAPVPTASVAPSDVDSSYGSDLPPDPSAPSRLDGDRTPDDITTPDDTTTLRVPPSGDTSPDRE